MGIPFKYLGLQVGGNLRRKLFWLPVLEKIRSKLNVWKERHLSMAGRICLIKVVFTALPRSSKPLSLCAKQLQVFVEDSYGIGGEKTKL